MALSRRYRPQQTEPRIQARWQLSNTYKFEMQSEGPLYAIDTPPATVSGKLHMGHVYSYSHADFMARFWRMNGRRVFYPMGYDDNGLPTERLVESQLRATASQIGRQKFIQQCLRLGETIERDYENLWRRLGLSVDWSSTYRTIEDGARRLAQASFIDLYQKNLAYRQEAPAIWCPECGTAIAQAELNEIERESEFVTVDFHLQGATSLPIATTRPELLSACVAVFVHPDDDRYRSFIGCNVSVPLYGNQVPVLQDTGADPETGTGAVMCCTFGDATDVAWWRSHNLPQVSVIDRKGRMTADSGMLTGLSVPDARRQIVSVLEEHGLMVDRRRALQSIRIHERCETPTEYIVAPQWFIRVLDFKDRWLEASDRITWHPPHMEARYVEWIENLHWDWCISRQRYFGIPFPVWYCGACENITMAPENELPADPIETSPASECTCGAVCWVADTDVMDTWATSSLSPQIAAGQLTEGEPKQSDFPMSMRPQSHEIIRTWAFYTIVMSHHHHGRIPWKEICISGWGLAPAGAGKISKSRGGGPAAPMAMIEKYSADAVRYWAAGTGFGKDTVISEEKIRAGAKLVTKLWNVARFSEQFLQGYRTSGEPPPLTLADRWILARTQRLVNRTTGFFRNYQYALARSETESFFLRDLADNYLEMAKRRLYGDTGVGTGGAQYTLDHVLRTCIHLFAPFLPYVTEEVNTLLFARNGESIHTSAWPTENPHLLDDCAETTGNLLVEIATAVRRYKSESSLSLGTPLNRLLLAVRDHALSLSLTEAESDLTSITRAQNFDVVLNNPLNPGLHVILDGEIVTAAIEALSGLPVPCLRSALF
ncbi:MAG: valine--tRNA ligase [Candidatus Latescibacteria bacterium]|nr:valine--tRNA ligase [Candidatus Latescibacterota bacterium]